MTQLLDMILLSMSASHAPRARLLIGGCGSAGASGAREKGKDCNPYAVWTLRTGNERHEYVRVWQISDNLWINPTYIVTVVDTNDTLTVILAAPAAALLISEGTSRRPASLFDIAGLHLLRGIAARGTRSSC